MNLNRLIGYLIAKVMRLNNYIYIYMPILIKFQIPIFNKKIDDNRGETIGKYIHVTTSIDDDKIN